MSSAPTAGSGSTRPSGPAWCCWAPSSSRGTSSPGSSDSHEWSPDPGRSAGAARHHVCGRGGCPVARYPQPLYQLLVLSHLLSARIRAQIAVAAARALFSHGLRTPRRMADATWQERVDALGEGGYRRYDERTATQLGDGALLLLDAYGGDLRRLRREADGDSDVLRSGLRRFPGIGPAGADIFLREVQTVWPETAPYLDKKALQGSGTARAAHRAGRAHPAGEGRGPGRARRGAGTRRAGQGLRALSSSAAVCPAWWSGPPRGRAGSVRRRRGHGPWSPYGRPPR